MGPVRRAGAGHRSGWLHRRLDDAVLARSGVATVGFDLRRRPSLLLGEAVIHLAGLQMPYCRAAPALGARVNVEGAVNVLEVARRNDLSG